MSEPTVEEVREALDRWYQWDDDDLSIGKDHPFWPMVAAARLWVDAAEPDYEAVASVKIWGDIGGIPPPVDVRQAKSVVDVAFGDNTLIRRADR